MLLSLFQLHIVELPPTATLGASLCAFGWTGMCSGNPRHSVYMVGHPGLEPGTHNL